jgi:hypothetical protein
VLRVRVRMCDGRQQNRSKSQASEPAFAGSLSFIGFR